MGEIYRIASVNAIFIMTRVLTVSELNHLFSLD